MAYFDQFHHKIVPSTAIPHKSVYFLINFLFFNNFLVLLHTAQVFHTIKSRKRNIFYCLELIVRVRGLSYVVLRCCRYILFTQILQTYSFIITRYTIFLFKKIQFIGMLWIFYNYGMIMMHFFPVVCLKKHLQEMQLHWLVVIIRFDCCVMGTSIYLTLILESTVLKRMTLWRS